MAALTSLFCVLLLNICVLSTYAENNTSYNVNMTDFPDQNSTFNVTDVYTTTESTQFELTTPTPTTSRTTQPPEPVLPPDPLPISGRLLEPTTNVAVVCPCDEHKDMCDLNCCCDSQCGAEVALFTGCLVHTVSDSGKLCNRDVASYSLSTRIDGYSELQSSVQKEKNYDTFCIYTQNRVDGLSHPSPALPTDRNFDSLFEKFTSFTFSSEGSNQGSTTESQAGSGYQYGDIMTTMDNGQQGIFFLPSSGLTEDCVDTSPAAFLKDQSGQCSRRVELQQDCESLSALNMYTYTNIQLLSGKTTNAALIPVEVVSIVLQSLEGTQTETQLNNRVNLLPVLLSPTLCSNVVLKVVYTIKYKPNGEIVIAAVSLVLGFIRDTPMPFQQTFQIQFLQENGPEVALQLSGNPGYIVGLPLVSGYKTTDGLSRSINPKDTLSLLQTSLDQDCLMGPQLRSPILFGHDSVTGCTLRLEDATNCSLTSQLLLDVLRGPNYPQFVASFGNSPLERQLDWVSIKRTFNPQDSPSCGIPLSLHLEIEWTKYGTLVNPQAQIVSINEIIQTNSSQLALLSGGSSIIPIRTSVSFISVSAPATPGYRAMPTIDAKLPFDFFFPFA